MRTPISDVIAELERVLEPGRFSDYCVNGLQVPGPEHVGTLATGVSASAALFELAAEENADLVLVHHGLFWDPGIRALDGVLARRLRLLFDADMALAGYHLPLDAHRDLGNNALLAQALRAERTEPFALHRGEPIGCLASLPGAGMSAGELLAAVREITGREPLALGADPAAVRTLAIVSGGGADYVDEAAVAGADAFLTGEAPERTMGQARELGLLVIAAGHYATETFGVKRLGEYLAARFDLRHTFIDVPNPV
jgi:dinuclear metal center YbgI/SA1388 family protein